MESLPLHDELLTIFDADRNEIGILPRSIVKTEPLQHWFGVSDILIVDAQNRILCSKRSDTVRRAPGKWQIRLGGHKKADQSFLDAAIAELYEESGLRATAEDLTLIQEGAKEKHLQHFSYYAYRFKPTDAINFVDGELADTCWMTIEEQLADRQRYPDKWCNSLHEETRQRLEAWMHSHP